jgi:hypothetical protein
LAAWLGGFAKPVLERPFLDQLANKIEDGESFLGLAGELSGHAVG